MSGLLVDARDREGVRVLVVDDESAVAEVTATFLEREYEAFDVAVETDPTVVTDRLGETDFDCVVCDYDMPGMDGLAVLRAVRDDYEDLPFVLFTGKGSEEIAAEAIAAGVTDYLQKESGTDQYAVLGNRVENAVERYRAERSRRALREQYRDLVENAPYAVFISDGERVLYANETWSDLLGADSPAEVEGVSKAEFVADEELSTVEDRVERVTEEERPVEWREKRIVGFDGTERTVESSGAPLTRDGETGIQVVARDVSERVRRERELREAKERFRKVFEYSNDAIMLVELESERFLEVNAAACEMLGYEESELLELHPADIHPEDIDRIREEFISEVRSEGYGFTDDMTCLTSDGEEVPAEVSGALLELGDAEEPTTMVAILRDVSEREAYRRDLEREVERLEEFASVVSHDLRNPLNVARARVELLGDEVDSEHLPVVERAHERMETLIDDLLVLAREGDPPGDRETLDLAETVRTCWRNVETEEATLSLDVDRTVEADRSRLGQLLENLIRNAVEHGSTSPRSSSTHEDAIEHGGDTVTVTVADTDEGFYVADDGRGIAESEREDVFEPGYTTADDGTGLGLRIVERVADAHDWSVAVGESEDGGARFDVTGVETPAPDADDGGVTDDADGGP